MDKKVTLSGSKVKTIRKAMTPRITQEWVADKLGVSRITYVGWEKSAEFRITLHEAEKLAKILKSSLESIQISGISEVKEPKEGYKPAESIDVLTAFKRLEELENTVIKGKDQTIEAKEGEIKRLREDSLFYQETIRELTKGLSSLKKV